MASKAAITACLFAGLFAVAVTGQAPAPAPSTAPNDTVTGLFIVTAGKVAFASNSTLLLTQLANTSQYLTFPPDPRFGVLSQAQLASPAFGANGSWAGSPQAVLAGSYNGQLKTILLELDTPVFTESTMQLTFQYKVLAAATDVPSVGGTVDSFIDKYGNFTTPTLPYVVPGSTAFYNASLSIDVVDIDRYLRGAQRAAVVIVYPPVVACCWRRGWRG